MVSEGMGIGDMVEVTVCKGCALPTNPLVNLTAENLSPNLSAILADQNTFLLIVLIGIILYLFKKEG